MASFCHSPVLGRLCVLAPNRPGRGWFESNYSRLPGTKTKSAQRAASIRIVTTVTTTARRTSSLRMYGSRTRENLNGVYSLSPMKASTGSSEY